MSLPCTRFRATFSVCGPRTDTIRFTESESCEPWRSLTAGHTMPSTICSLMPRWGLHITRRVFDPYRSGHAGDVRVANTRDWINNRWFPLAIQTGQLLPPLGRGRKIDWLANTEDWVGVNYYTREFCQFAPGQPLAGFSRDPQPKVERNQLGWEIYPEGLYRALMVAAPPGSGKRIIVTENGVPEAAIQT